MVALDLILLPRQDNRLSFLFGFVFLVIIMNESNDQRLQHKYTFIYSFNVI